MQVMKFSVRQKMNTELNSHSLNERCELHIILSFAVLETSGDNPSS
jgi:hypothetical protein